MINLTSEIQQLNDIYYKEEWWQSHNETIEGITYYHEKMIQKGNIITYLDNGKLLGYVEFWRINYEQFGRLICHLEFIAPKENTTDGNICYVANVWIDKNHRFGEVFKYLKREFFRANYHCDFFVGEALRKKTQPVKVFTRKDFYNKYAK